MSLTEGAVQGGPRILLRLEGAAILVLATAAFGYGHHSWWLYGLLFLAPDLSMLGYLAGPRLGALSYNAGHTLLGAGLLAGLGLFRHDGLVLSLAAIWAAHIGFDRMLGYGLKYQAGFGVTHLGRIGRNRSAMPVPV